MGSSITRQQIEELRQKYGLKDLCFDTECIYEQGDLTALLVRCLPVILPGCNATVTEAVSADGARYIATVTNGAISAHVPASTYGDFLPDEFFGAFEQLPVVFGTGNMLVSVHPLLVFTGQDIWYFYGAESDLRQAKQEGLPILFDGDEIDLYISDL